MIDLRIAQSLGIAVDPAAWHAGALKRRDEFGDRALGKCIVQQLSELGLVARSVDCRREARVLQQVQPFRYLADRTPKSVVAGRQHEIAIARLEALIGGVARVGRAKPPWIATTSKI